MATFLASVCGLQGEELGFEFGGYWADRHGREALDKSQRVLDDKGWLTLHGGYGTGKTYLLCAIVNEARRRGLLALYAPMSLLLDHLRAAYKPGAEVEYDAWWANVCRAHVLCIDEVEKYKATEWAEEKATGMFKERYRRWRETVTAVATNSFEDVPGWLKSLCLDRRFEIADTGRRDVRRELAREVEG